MPGPTRHADYVQTQETAAGHTAAAGTPGGVSAELTDYATATATATATADLSPTSTL